MSPPYCYDYPRPMATVDLVVFALDETGLKSLFIKRRAAPFADHWAIPGGYLDLDETFEVAARRELREETGLDGLGHVEEIGTFGEPGRDPRGRTISIAHAAVIRGPLPRVAGGDDAKDAAWLDPAGVAHLAFDHAKIVAKALDWLRGAIARDEVVFTLLPECFTKADVDLMLRSVVGKTTSGARWITAGRRAGCIEEIAGSPGRFRASAHA